MSRQQLVHGFLAKARTGCGCRPCRVCLAKHEGRVWYDEDGDKMQYGVAFKMLGEVTFYELASRMIEDGTLARSMNKLNEAS